MKIRIVTDSTCDLPADTIARYGIQVVPLFINVGTQGYLDGIDMSREEFYTKLPTFAQHPTTAVPSPLKFRAVYDDLAEAGATAVLSIHISISLSAVVDQAHIAARDTRSVAVTVFDSQQLSLGTGFQVEMAAQLAEQGKSVGEIVAVLNQQIKRTHVFTALDTLEFLKRSGRMNRFVAGFGTLLQLKPILTMYDGKPGSERVRTHGRAMQRLLEMLRSVGPLERVAIIHTHALDRVAEIRKLAAHLLPPGIIPVAEINPVIGTHIGPGVVGFAVVGAMEA